MHQNIRTIGWGSRVSGEIGFGKARPQNVTTHLQRLKQPFNLPRGEAPERCSLIGKSGEPGGFMGVHSFKETVAARTATQSKAKTSGVPLPRGGPPPILKPYRRRCLRPGASQGGPAGPVCTRAAAGFGHAIYSMVLVSGRPLRVDVRTCHNSSIFSILQCFTPAALVSHNSAQSDTSFVHFEP